MQKFSERILKDFLNLPILLIADMPSSTKLGILMQPGPAPRTESTPLRSTSMSNGTPNVPMNEWRRVSSDLRVYEEKVNEGGEEKQRGRAKRNNGF